ncbi:MAG: hypothetical protein M3367_03020 [Acidobacteriota bacterium]|nr:hypothetical protein [Acidobacteriota bacterium]
MAKLKRNLTAEEFETIADSLKDLYVPTADGYLLDADDVEDVSGLKTALEKERRERREAKEALKQYEGLDPEDARKAVAEVSKIDEKKLLDKQKFDEVLENYRKDFDTELEKERREKQQLLTNLKREKLTNLLIEKGVLPDRARFALAEVDPQTEIVSDEGGISLKKKDGIGDAKELDEMVTGLREKSAFLFAPTNASGSGATQSNGNGNGNGNFNSKVEPGQSRIVAALNAALPPQNTI